MYFYFHFLFMSKKRNFPSRTVHVRARAQQLVKEGKVAQSLGGGFKRTGIPLYVKSGWLVCQRPWGGAPESVADLLSVSAFLSLSDCLKVSSSSSPLALPLSWGCRFICLLVCIFFFAFFVHCFFFIIAIRYSILFFVFSLF